MKKLLGIIKKRRSLVLVLAFAPLCLGVLISTGSSAPQDVKKRAQTVSPVEVQIVNNTTTLDATFEITKDNHLFVRIKNLSSKDMNGYVLSLNGIRMTCDISIADRVVSTGETDNQEMLINSPLTKLTLLAAMFSDGSIEAEPDLKKELTELRLGMKKELVHNLARLDEILKSPDAYSTKAFDRIDANISSRNSDTVHSLSEEGAEQARNGLNSELKMLKQRQQPNGNAMQRQELLDLRGRIERRIARL
jgi:cytochrome c556